MAAGSSYYGSATIRALRSARIRAVSLVLLALLAHHHEAGADPARVAIAAAGTGSIVLEIRGFRSSNGMVMATLYTGPEGFPSKGGWKRAQARVVDGTANLVFEVPHGQYAVACFHDENGNAKLDTNWLGIPKEGVCASNDAKARLGPPKYDDAKFELRGERHVQRVKITYL